ncbi:class I SAM-dependent methyltransferase [Deinococcus radiomollis]|uniref:class I SAM-dependent methyltransferase n=1 Tax=Deinococcus radiomollis TaxID=468916 RepID=UPI00389237D9
MTADLPPTDLPAANLPAANDPSRVAAQYATDRHLQTRIRTHRLYSVGTELEADVDALLALDGSEALLDVGSGPGHFPGRLHAAGHRGRLVGADLSGGMVAAARASYGGVEFVQAGADALPFPDASFDVLTARHMLYHVPNVPAALAEFRRVLKPGGHFLATTNAAAYMPELWDAVAEAAQLEGALIPLTQTRGGVAAAFSEINGGAWVQEAFGNARLSFSDNALVFPDPQPALDYLESDQEWLNLDQAQKIEGHRALLQVLNSKFTSGPWRVSKKTAFITAER